MAQRLCLHACNIVVDGRSISALRHALLAVVPWPFVHVNAGSQYMETE